MQGWLTSLTLGQNLEDKITGAWEVHEQVSKVPSTVGSHSVACPGQRGTRGQCISTGAEHHAKWPSVLEICGNNFGCRSDRWCPRAFPKRGCLKWKANGSNLTVLRINMNYIFCMILIHPRVSRNITPWQIRGSLSFVQNIIEPGSLCHLVKNDITNGNISRDAGVACDTLSRHTGPSIMSS